MSRALASVQKITDINPILGADSIEVASILGWKCVVKKDQFKAGDMCIYFEIDSLLPIIPEFEFLASKGTKKLEDGTEGYRLRTVKLRGQISQGLAWPISILDKYGIKCEVGEDISKKLNVCHWQPIIPACLRGKIKGSFPDFIPKTDETRVQNLQSILTRHKGKKCYISEKIDGSSITCYLKDGKFGVCSRNIEFDLEDTSNAYIDTVKKLNVEEKMRKLFENQNVAMQGELYGTGIQGNSMMIVGHDIAWFNIFDIDTYHYASFSEFETALSLMGLKSVPILSVNYILSDNVDEILAMSKAKSVINPKTEREGIVIRPLIEEMDLQMSKGMSNARLSFKAINENYLLTHDEA